MDYDVDSLVCSHSSILFFICYLLFANYSPANTALLGYFCPTTRHNHQCLSRHYICGSHLDNLVFKSNKDIWILTLKLLHIQYGKGISFSFATFSRLFLLTPHNWAIFVLSSCSSCLSHHYIYASHLNNLLLKSNKDTNFNTESLKRAQWPEQCSKYLLARWPTASNFSVGSVTLKTCWSGGLVTFFKHFFPVITHTADFPKSMVYWF